MTQNRFKQVFIVETNNWTINYLDIRTGIVYQADVREGDQSVISDVMEFLGVDWS